MIIFLLYKEEKRILALNESKTQILSKTLVSKTRVIDWFKVRNIYTYCTNNLTLQNNNCTNNSIGFHVKFFYHMRKVFSQGVIFFHTQYFVSKNLYIVEEGHYIVVFFSVCLHYIQGGIYERQTHAIFLHAGQKVLTK